MRARRRVRRDAADVESVEIDIHEIKSNQTIWSVGLETTAPNHRTTARPDARRRRCRAASARDGGQFETPKRAKRANGRSERRTNLRARDRPDDDARRTTPTNDPMAPGKRTKTKRKDDGKSTEAVRDDDEYEHAASDDDEDEDEEDLDGDDGDEDVLMVRW